MCNMTSCCFVFPLKVGVQICCFLSILNLAWLTLGLVYAFGKLASFVIEYVIAKLFNMFSWHDVPHFVFKFLILMVYYSFWKEIKNVEGDYGLELNFEPSYEESQ
ncbi:uncharacterized protein LOC106660985 [Cimex lectularius]|uniref:Uncharacterized protein n=1 Tax=Cimex lectularius TaxID=79782 RepID=A0A8I6R6X6_CIMLE|nr:uncharacterized protein LOC106660985 [Cimex lectularius]